MENKKFTKIFLSDVLEDYIQQRRWYGGKASKLKYIELREYFRIQQKGEVYYGLLLEVNFEEAGPRYIEFRLLKNFTVVRDNADDFVPADGSIDH